MGFCFQTGCVSPVYFHSRKGGNICVHIFGFVGPIYSPFLCFPQGFKGVSLCVSPTWCSRGFTPLGFRRPDPPFYLGRFFRKNILGHRIHAGPTPISFRMESASPWGGYPFVETGTPFFCLWEQKGACSRWGG